MEEFLRRGSFFDLGFYVWVRHRLRVGERFTYGQIGEELFLSDVAIRKRFDKLKAIGAIETEQIRGRGLQGSKVTKFNFDFEVKNDG